MFDHLGVESGHKAFTSLQKIHIDFLAQLHAVLELMLVVALSTLGFNILLDTVNSRLVLNELFLDVVEAVVYFTLQDLIFLGVVLHGVEGYLLGQTSLVDLQEFFNFLHSELLLLKLCLQFVCSREFIMNIVVHAFDLIFGLLHFFFDSAFKILHFFEIILD